METVLMILCWIGFALGMCVVPIVFRDDYRQLVWNRLRYGTWQVGEEQRNRTTHTTTTTTTSTQRQQDKQALAALCEARVRQALLSYTRTVQSQDILHTTTTGTSAQLDPTATNVNQSSPQCIIHLNTQDDDSSRHRQHYETAASDTSSTSDDDDDKVSSVDDDVDDVEAAMSPSPLDLGEDYGQIKVPMAGSTVVSNDNENVPWRCVSNQCTICLSPFSANSDDHHPHISWSSNPQCVHVFHSACITHWLSEAGRRHVQRRLRRRRQQQEEPQKEILLDFPMQCPCCRQAFVRPTKHKEEDVGLPDGSRSTTTTAQPYRDCNGTSRSILAFGRLGYAEE